MVVTMARVMAGSEASLVRCAECGQVLARREHNRLVLLGAELLIDSHGRPVVVCPVCKRSVVVRRHVDETRNSA